MFFLLKRLLACYKAVAISPTGDRAVVGTATRTFGEALIVSLPDGRVMRRWRPYAREGAGVACVVCHVAGDGL